MGMALEILFPLGSSINAFFFRISIFLPFLPSVKKEVRKSEKDKPSNPGNQLIPYNMRVYLVRRNLVYAIGMSLMLHFLPLSLSTLEMKTMDWNDLLITLTALSTVFLYPFVMLWLCLWLLPPPWSAMMFLLLHSPFMLLWFYKRIQYDKSDLEAKLHPGTSTDFQDAMASYIKLVKKEGSESSE